MKRPKAYCPACESEVEMYSDGIGGNHEWRCGNCFQGFNGEQLTRLEKLKAELDRHEDERQQLLIDALR
jgi:transposase-like protein